LVTLWVSLGRVNPLTTAPSSC